MQKVVGNLPQPTFQWDAQISMQLIIGWNEEKNKWDWRLKRKLLYAEAKSSLTTSGKKTLSHCLSACRSVCTHTQEWLFRHVPDNSTLSLCASSQARLTPLATLVYSCVKPSVQTQWNRLLCLFVKGCITRNFVSRLKLCSCWEP